MISARFTYDGVLFAQRTSEGGSTSRHDSMNVGVLLHHMENFGGVVVAITNRYASRSRFT